MSYRGAVAPLGTIIWGTFGGLAVTTFGTPGLIVLSVVLAIAVVFRRAPVALFCAVSAGVALGFWTLAIIRCEQTPGRTCTVEGAGFAMFAWAGAVLVIGLVATWALVARSRPH
jgi:hypothetical protein